MPLDVLLVEGNTFRVPPRRVWEKEGMWISVLLPRLTRIKGSKGLLKWLADRV